MTEKKNSASTGGEALFAIANSDHTWADTYFDDKVSAEDLVAVFDVNYVALKRKFYCIAACFLPYAIFLSWAYSQLPLDGFYLTEWFSYLQAALYLSFFGSIVFMVASSPIRNVHSLHVAVTRQGVRKDSNRFPYASSFNNSTMMPYNEISNVFVRRLCCGAFGEGEVHIVAAADQTSHPIQGLKDPDGFVALVKRMMEQNEPAISTADGAWVLPDSKTDEAHLMT